MATTNTPNAERRAFERVPHHARAILSTGQGEVQAAVLDMSVGGLGLRTSGPVRCGEFVRVRLPLDPGDGRDWVDPDAVVVRVVPNPDTGMSTVGLAFCELSERIREQLADRVSASHLAAAARARACSSGRVSPTAPAPGPGASTHASDEIAAERQALRDLVVGAPPPARRRPSARSAPSRLFAALASAFGPRTKPTSARTKARR